MSVIAGDTPTCSAPSCSATPAWQWQRYGTQAEYDALADTKLQPRDNVLRVSVFACTAHALSSDEMTFTHQQACPWPSACTCAASDSAPTYTAAATSS